jgi:cytochrome o ubiquinol oxidase subunit 3
MTVSVETDGDGITLSPGEPITLSPVKVGMLAFLASEVAFFGTLIMSYVYFLRQTIHGEPNPSQVFRLPMVLAASACLFSSSATIHVAQNALRHKSRQTFLGWW